MPLLKNSFVPVVCTGILMLIALLLIFGPLLHLLTLGPVHTHFHLFHRNYLASSVISLPIIGIMLFYMATFIYRRRRLAAIASILVCVLLLIYLFVIYAQDRVTLFTGVLVGLYILLVLTHFSHFNVKNSFEGSIPYLFRTMVVAVIGVLYGFMGFYFFGHLFFHEHFSPLASLDLTLDSLTGFSGTVSEPTRLGQVYIDSLGGVGIIIFIFLLNSLFRPLRLKLLSHQHGDLEKAERLIKQHSRSSEDFFKLWPEDKRYYFSEQRTAFIAYKLSGRTVIILGDPVGDRRHFTALVRQFIAYCDSLEWSVAVISASSSGQKLYKRLGLSSLFIGNEGTIDTHEFMGVTSTNKHFRYVANRARRDALIVEEWKEVSHAQLAELRAISHNWLTRGGRREYSFFMGYFDTTYLRKCRIFVFVENGRPVGYINLIPSYYKGHASIDHLRSRENISPVGMHYLLMKIIEALYRDGIHYLNIGFSPLSGIDKHTVELLPRTALRIMRLLGTSYYSFRGLEQFKNKFKPRWEPQTLLYSRPATSLVGIVRDIERASAYENRVNHTLVLSTVIGVVILTIGLYLILA